MYRGRRHKVSQVLDKGDYSKARCAHQQLAAPVAAIADVGDCLPQERAVSSQASSDSNQIKVPKIMPADVLVRSRYGAQAFQCLIFP
jgi:hypothetical protein